MAGAIQQNGPGRIAWRLLAAFGGGYALVSGFVAMMGQVLPLIGVARGEAVALALMLALFIYVPVCLMMFATPRPWRDGLAVLATAAALILLARAI
jgi:hypothetical protein